MSRMALGLILLTVTLSACAQLALKLGVNRLRLGEVLQQSGLVDVASSVFLSPLIWLGLLVYGFSVALWLWVLSQVELSVAYPFVGISFIMTLVFGVFLLDENVTPTRIIGTVLIAFGCVLVGKSS